MGISAYKGVFTSLAEAQESGKTICLFPGSDGKVYELRKTKLGEREEFEARPTSYGISRNGNL